MLTTIGTHYTDPMPNPPPNDTHRFGPDRLTI